MPYTIEIERPAQKQLAKINNPFLEVIIEKINALRIDPRPQGCKKLIGMDGWRIRIADYRVIYKMKIMF